MTEMECARDAASQLDDAVRSIRSTLDRMGNGSNGDLDLHGLAVMVETARTARTASADLLMFVSAIAIDGGVSPQVLDWNLDD